MPKRVTRGKRCRTHPDVKAVVQTIIFCPACRGAEGGSKVTPAKLAGLERARAVKAENALRRRRHRGIE